MRTSHIKHVSRNTGNVKVEQSRIGKCECGKAAIWKLTNSYRESFACASVQCREREIAWVGNMPYRLNSKGATNPRLVRKPYEKPKSRALDLKKPADRARIKGA